MIVLPMYEFWLVIKDLLRFVKNGFKDEIIYIESTPSIADYKEEVILNSSQPKLVALPSYIENVSAPVTESISNLPIVPIESVDMASTGLLSNEQKIYFNEPTIMYCGIYGAPCLLTPFRDFDNVIGRLDYGDAVTVIGYTGQYAEVLKGEIKGFVAKENLFQKKSEVWANLQNNVLYEADNSEVIKIRKLIEDEFALADLSVGLNPAEHVSLRLLEDKREINWPYGSTMRRAGEWQNILRGARGIHIGISPLSDSVMEWRTEFGVGHLAYVRDVLPDKTIVAEIVGYSDSGVYQECTWSYEQWKEWRPVFIEVL